jgi:hypothetical protein
LFCDGGTFDNLPFIPAIEILSSAQKAYVQREHPDPTDFLAERLRQPHLIISGGFDPDPEQDHRPRFESRSDISARCTALAAEVKTASFIKMSRIVAEQLRTLNTLPPTPERDRIRTSSVVTGIVSVVPATDLHVNPTFGFARSVGFQPERVAASIADGCFQTLRNLQQNKSTAESETALSLEALKINVFPREPNAAISKGDCPYFQLTCPFVQAAESARNANNPLQSKACDGVYAACRRDAVHQKLHFLATLPKSAASLIDAVDTGTLRSLP